MHVFSRSRGRDWCQQNSTGARSGAWTPRTVCAPRRTRAPAGCAPRTELSDFFGGGTVSPPMTAAKLHQDQEQYNQGPNEAAQTQGSTCILLLGVQLMAPGEGFGIL
eukprot:2186519-Prymnesium_polylepis.1